MAMTAENLRGPLRFAIDLKSGLIQQPIRSQLMKGDKSANTVIVELTEDKKEVDLSGVTVTGSFISPLEGAEISLTGSTDGNKAIVTLIDECYAEDGYFECHIKLTVGQTRRTILSFTGYVLSKGSGAVIDIGGVIPSIEDIIAQYTVMKEVTQSAQEATKNANTATENANNATTNANNAAGKINGMTVSAVKGDNAGAAVSEHNGVKHIAFTLPKGDKGDKGEKGDTGSIENLSINGKPVESGNITLSASDVAALPDTGTAVHQFKPTTNESADYWGIEQIITGISDVLGATGLRFFKDNVVRIARLPDGTYRAYKIYDEANKPSAEDVGAVRKTGDTMSGNLAIRTVSRYPSISMRSEQQSTNETACEISANLEDDTRRFGFNQFHQDMDGAETRYKDCYLLPNATEGLTESKYYNILTSKKPVTIEQGGTNAKTKEEARAALGAMEDYGRGALLWEGSWASGTITVPNTSNYNLFKIAMSGQGTAIIAAKQGGYIRGIGGYTTDAPKIITYHFGANYADDTWTFVACNNITHNVSSNHSTVTTLTITSIVGLG